MAWSLCSRTQRISDSLFSLLTNHTRFANAFAQNSLLVLHAASVLVLGRTVHARWQRALRSALDLLDRRRRRFPYGRARVGSRDPCQTRYRIRGLRTELTQLLNRGQPILLIHILFGGAG